MAFYLASTWKTMGGCQEFSTNTITKVMYVSIKNSKLHVYNIYVL